ncbi:MAG: hypothetical protein JNK02_12370 [Planctomycetes bacterium]|nr:hypothetical protein [Planctomycetota bacterium]
MDGPSALIFGVLLPAVVAGIVLLVSARRARAEPAAPRPVAGALGFGGAYLVAHAVLSGVPPIPWSEDALSNTGRLFWLVAGAVLLAPVRCAPFLRRFGDGFYVAFFAILPYHWIRDPGLERGVFDLAGIGSVLLSYGIWRALEALARRRPGPGLPAALWAASAGTAGMLLANASAKQAQLVGALAAALGAAVVVALLVRGAHLASGAIAILAVVVISMLRLAVVYDLPTVSWVLAAVAFLAPWVGEFPGLRTRSPLLAGAAAFLAALAASGAAAWFAFAARSAARASGY